jgi:hypothetical protein
MRPVRVLVDGDKIVSKSVDPGRNPRLVISRDYIRDARRIELSTSTRLRCAWESIYFCCCEVATVEGPLPNGREHPDRDIVENALWVFAASANQQRRVEAMFYWASYQQPVLPEPCSPEDACDLAETIHAQTVALLSSSMSGG